MAHHPPPIDILQFHLFQNFLFSKLNPSTQTKEQVRKFFKANYHFYSKPLVLTSLPNFLKKNSSPFLAISDNRRPFFYNLRDFPVTHFDYLFYDNHSLDKSLEVPPPLRPYAKRTPQFPSFDATSDVSFQSIPSATQYLVNTQKMVIQRTPNLDPPSLNNAFTAQPSHSPHQYNILSNSHPPSNPNTMETSTSQILQSLPPIHLSSPNVITTQPQAHSIRTSLPPFLSSHHNPPSSISTSQIPPTTLSPSSLPPPSTFFDL